MQRVRLHPHGSRVTVHPAADQAGPVGRVEGVTGGAASSHRRVARATVIVAIATGLVSLLGFLKDVVLVRHLGVGPRLDALVTAFLLPNLGASVVAGSLALALIPVYVATRRQFDAEAGRMLALKTIRSALLVLVLITALLGVTAPLVVRGLGVAFDPATRQLTKELYLLFLPAIILSGFSGVFTALLNADERFLMAAIAPALAPIGAIVGLAFISSAPGAPVWPVAAGTTIGFLAQAVLLLGALRWPPRLLVVRPVGLDGPLQQVMAEYWPVLVGTLLMTGMNLVDQVMVSALPSGSVASMNYGGRIVNAVSGIGGVAIGATVLPHFARRTAAREWDRLWRDFVQYSGVAILLGGIAAALLALLSAPLVQLFFGGPRVNADGLALISRVQAILAFQLPFFLASLLAARVLSALGRSRWIMLVSGANVVLNAVGNLILIPRMGVPGAALSTTLTYVVAFALMTFGVRRAVLSQVSPAA